MDLVRSYMNRTKTRPTQEPIRNTQQRSASSASLLSSNNSASVTSTSIITDTGQGQSKTKNKEMDVNNNDTEPTTLRANNDYPDLWNEMRNSNILTDGVIKASDSNTFHVHRGIFALISPYFYAQFIKKRVKVIKFEDIDKETIHHFIEFAYKGKCNVTEENYTKILPLAAAFKIPPLIYICWKFLAATLNVQNCIKIYKTAKPHFCRKLRKVFINFIVTHFDQIVNIPDFKEIDALDMEEFLRHDKLNLLTEEKVFEAMKMWVEFDLLERADHLPALLTHVRFGLMELRYYNEYVRRWPVFMHNMDIRRAFFEKLEYMSRFEIMGGPEFDFLDPNCRPRTANEILFAIGGWSAGSPTSFMETFDFRANQWFFSEYSDTNPRAYFGIAVVNKKIYLVGGFDGREHFNSVRCFDPMTKIWSDKSCLNVARCYVACCSLGNMIYAIGGYNGRLRLNSAERYNVDTNQWETIAPMARVRSDCSSCSCGGKVYVAGGFNGQEVLSSVEVYDPKENEWTYIHPMRTPRSGNHIITYNKKLYCIGGFNGTTRLNTCERYNPSYPGDWIYTDDMNSPRSNFSTCILYDRIFVMGGFNGRGTIDEAEYYEEATNKWTMVHKMNINRSALSSCVVSGFPNSKEFGYLYRFEEMLGLPPNTEDD